MDLGSFSMTMHQLTLLFCHYKTVTAWAPTLQSRSCSLWHKDLWKVWDHKCASIPKEMWQIWWRIQFGAWENVLFVVKQSFSCTFCNTPLSQIMLYITNKIMLFWQILCKVSFKKIYIVYRLNSDYGDNLFTTQPSVLHGETLPYSYVGFYNCWSLPLLNHQNQLNILWRVKKIMSILFKLSTFKSFRIHSLNSSVVFGDSWWRSDWMKQNLKYLYLNYLVAGILFKYPSTFWSNWKSISNQHRHVVYNFFFALHIYYTFYIFKNKFLH